MRWIVLSVLSFAFPLAVSSQDCAEQTRACWDCPLEFAGCSGTPSVQFSFPLGSISLNDFSCSTTQQVVCGGSGGWPCYTTQATQGGWCLGVWYVLGDEGCCLYI